MCVNESRMRAVSGTRNAASSCSLRRTAEKKMAVKLELTLSTFLSCGFGGSSTSLSVPQSGSSLSLPHLAYLRFLSMARKSMPLESDDHIASRINITAVP